MITMRINLEGDGLWPDLPEKEVVHLTNPIEVTTLPGGTSHGKPSVSFRFDLPDGRVVVAETSARLFVTAAQLIAQKYPDLFEGQ